MRAADSQALLAPHAEACNYPGRLDEAQVERALAEYLGALKMDRRIVRLRQGWRIEDHSALRRFTLAVLDDLGRRAGWSSAAALDAPRREPLQSPADARAALDALDARAARDALDARAARDARDALDALAALDARDARAARAARAARDALAARDARDARAALDALESIGGGLQRFAAWCVQGRGWYWYDWDLSWISTTYIGAVALGQTGHAMQWSKPLYDAFLAGCWILVFTDDTLYWVAKPTVHVERGEQFNFGRRLHNERYAAIESDGENLYFWHGVLVPAFVVVQPDWITVEHIQAEENAEVRRIMLERFESVQGAGSYVRAIGAKCVQADDWGKLYRVPRPDDSDLVFVEVTNKTPEPDGSFKQYMLRCHPELRPMRRDWLGEPQEDRALNAVASTFGMYGRAYAPAQET